MKTKKIYAAAISMAMLLIAAVSIAPVTPARLLAKPTVQKGQQQAVPAVCTQAKYSGSECPYLACPYLRQLQEKEAAAGGTCSASGYGCPYASHHAAPAVEQRNNKVKLLYVDNAVTSKTRKPVKSAGR